MRELKKERERRGGAVDPPVKPENDETPEKEPLGLLSKPRNIKELSMVMLCAHEDDSFGSDRVGDIFVDARSIDEFRNRGFRDGDIFIILAEKTHQGAELRPPMPNNTLVLKAAYSSNYPQPLFIRFTTSKQKRDRIVKKTKQGDKIALLGRWYHHPERNDVMQCDFLNPNCIAVLNSDLFEGL